MLPSSGGNLIWRILYVELVSHWPNFCDFRVSYVLNISHISEFALSSWKWHNKTTTALMTFEIWIRNVRYEKNDGQLRRSSAALRAKFFPESRSVNLLCFYCWLYFREIASKPQIKGMGIRSNPIFVFFKKVRYVRWKWYRENFDMCRPCKGFYLFSFFLSFFLSSRNVWSQFQNYWG